MQWSIHSSSQQIIMWTRWISFKKKEQQLNESREGNHFPHWFIQMLTYVNQHVESCSSNDSQLLQHVIKLQRAWFLFFFNFQNDDKSETDRPNFYDKLCDDYIIPISIDRFTYWVCSTLDYHILVMTVCSQQGYNNILPPNSITTTLPTIYTCRRFHRLWKCHIYQGPRYQGRSGYILN